MEVKFIEVINNFNNKVSINTFYISKVNTCDGLTYIWISNRDVLSAVKTPESYEEVMAKINGESPKKNNRKGK